MVNLIPIALFILVPLAGDSPAAQQAHDLAFILRTAPMLQNAPQERLDETPVAWEDPSEWRLAATGLIRVYQKFISPQDLPVCNFRPTCSRFGVRAIQRYGLLRGLLLTADRLLRDHGMIDPMHYPVDPETGRYLDPIENYSSKALR